VPIARPKSRGLLGLLLARANHGVPTDQLIDELWMHEPPVSAESAFRVHVSFLRKALRGDSGPDAAGPIGVSAGGYRIVVGAEALDSLAFEAALREARTASAAGAPEQTVRALERALTWRRGPAYADLTALEPLRDEAVRLEDQWLTAIELLADAYLVLGRARDVCDLMPAVITSHPLRETLTERLMLALYREGRQAEALRAFSRLREALDSELGVEPNPSVRMLEEAIILQRGDLDPVRHDRPRPGLELRETGAFIGRHREIDVIDRVWAQALSGQPRLVLIGGPAGIGKSALADHVAQRHAALGARVIVGTCDTDPASDYEPLPQLIRAMVEIAPPELLARPLLGELVRVAPDLAERLPEIPTSVDASAGRHRLFVAVDELLAGTTAVGPVLIVAEDLQWSGPDALALLRHLVHNGTGALMVVGTYRDDEVDPGTPLADALGQGRLARPDATISLGGLDTAELRALVQATAADDLRNRAMTRLSELHDVTMGNPLFAREVLRELAEAGDQVTIAEVAPGGVRSIVARRLVRLTPEARGLLAASAVLGREFSLELLARTTDMSEAVALDAIEEVVAARLFDETDVLDQFTFSHPLFRNTIYNTTPASRRARLHLQAGLALERVPSTHGSARSAELARHFLAALPLGDVARAAGHALRAGDEAAEAFAHAEAATWYGRAIDLAADAGWEPRQMAKALLALGQCLDRCGRRDEARAAYLRASACAKRADDAPLLADVAIAATPRYIALDDFHETHTALVDEALAASVGDPRREAWLLNSAGASRYYEDRGDEIYAKRALALARRWPDPEVQAAGLVTYRRWLTHDAVTGWDRLALSRELKTLCRERGLDRLVGQACRSLLVDLLEVGELGEFDDEFEEFATLADAHGLPSDLYWLSALRATRALMRAADPFAEELVHAAHTLGRALQQWDSEGMFVLQMFALRFQQDRVREIRAALEVPTPDGPRIVNGVALLAVALVASGRPDAARPILDRAVEGGRLRLPHDNMWLGATALMSGAAAAIGTPEQRALLFGELEPFARRWCAFGAGGAAFGTGHHWLGKLAVANGDVAAATNHFDWAESMSLAAGATYWAEVACADRLACTGGPALAEPAQAPVSVGRGRS
jgi:DNA-binding SARP family transcriptional activator